MATGTHKRTGKTSQKGEVMCRSADDPDAQGGPEYEYEKWLASNEADRAEWEYKKWLAANDEFNEESSR